MGGREEEDRVSLWPKAPWPEPVSVHFLAQPGALDPELACTGPSSCSEPSSSAFSPPALIGAFQGFVFGLSLGSGWPDLFLDECLHFNLQGKAIRFKERQAAGIRSVFL